ncbi:MAG: PASTA domain-containing protein [Clostridia bacterium]|nr:PASTA domain-containing protein [Clostridia bacterium]
MMSKICYGCMNIIEDDDDKCPHCGFDRSIRQSLPFLPLGAKLQDGKYMVGKKLSSNNESTKYIAFDERTESAVTIREFLPNGLCSRAEKDNSIRVRSEKTATYKRLLNKYLDYNRTLARLKDCPSVCRVIDIFTENNTAYVVEEKEELTSFTDYVKKNGGHIDWDTAYPLFIPLLTTLETMHKNGISHYGVGPSNVKMSEDGRLVLQNFSIADMRRVGSDLRSMLISGCSAPEQYDKFGILDESTDVYGFTAVLFYALTGTVPDDVEKRKNDNKLLISSSINKKLPPYVRSALAGGLQFEQEKRLKTFAEMRAKLLAAPTVKSIREELAQPDIDDDEDDNIPDNKKRKRSGDSKLPGVISCVVSLVLFVIIGTYWLQGNPFAAMFSPSDASSDSDAEATKGEMVTVPNLVGVKYEEAVEKADKVSDYKLLKAVEEEFSNDVPEGYIASQFPEAYTEEVQGYSLYITVSKGAKMRELPVITGKTVDQAAQLLGDESFITSQSFAYSDSVKKGLVIGYDSHNAGDKLEYGSSVEIKVSLGADTSSQVTSSRTKSSDTDTEKQGEEEGENEDEQNEEGNETGEEEVW